jgi:hypothetical protein
MKESDTSATYMDRLPLGQWYCDDHAGTRLAHVTSVVHVAVHLRTGAKFFLLRKPTGPIVGLSPRDRRAETLYAFYWPDPAGWAAFQQWHVLPDRPVVPTARIVTIVAEHAITALTGLTCTRIELPDGFENFSPQQRSAWARSRGEAAALQMLEAEAAGLDIDAHLNGGK